MFISLHRFATYNRTDKALVNPDEIAAFEEEKTDTDSSGTVLHTVITLKSGSVVTVREGVDEIAEMIREASEQSEAIR